MSVFTGFMWVLGGGGMLEPAGVRAADATSVRKREPLLTLWYREDASRSLREGHCVCLGEVAVGICFVKIIFCCVHGLLSRGLKP